MLLEMAEFPLAVIADVHGNVWALEAVLADAVQRGIRAIVNLGDSVYGPLAPGESAAMLMDAAIPSIRGNQDRILFEPAKEIDHPTLVYTRNALAPAQMDWLRAQPASRELDSEFGPDMLLCHGTPQSDETYLLEEVTPNGVFLRGPDVIKKLAGETHSIILCGHTHIPRAVWLGEGRMAVNPGSVGLPGYSDLEPYPHVMEAGSAHARYAILDFSNGRSTVSHLAVTYDWERAALRAEANGRKDWAFALRTGRAQSMR